MAHSRVSDLIVHDERNTHHAFCLCDICAYGDVRITTCTCYNCDTDGILSADLSNMFGITGRRYREKHNEICGCFINDILAFSCSTWPHDQVTRHWIDCDCGECAIGLTKCCHCPIHNPESDSKCSRVLGPWGKLVESIDDIQIWEDASSGFTVHVANEILFAINLADAQLAAREIIASRIPPAVVHSAAEIPTRPNGDAKLFTSLDGKCIVTLRIPSFSFDQYAVEVIVDGESSMKYHIPNTTSGGLTANSFFDAFCEMYKNGYTSDPDETDEYSESDIELGNDPRDDSADHRYGSGPLVLD